MAPALSQCADDTRLAISVYNPSVCSGGDRSVDHAGCCDAKPALFWSKPVFGNGRCVRCRCCYLTGSVLARRYGRRQLRRRLRVRCRALERVFCVLSARPIDPSLRIRCPMKVARSRIAVAPAHWLEGSGLLPNRHDLSIVSVMQKRINRVIPFIWCELVTKDCEFKSNSVRLRGPGGARAAYRQLSDALR